MNVIFGSGIVGLLAKMILGPDWKIVPFYKSRFFSFNPALDDNFIIQDDRLDHFICSITGDIKARTFLYNRSWSVGGHLMKQFNKDLCNAWLYKVFGSDIPPQSHACFNKMDLAIYDVRVNQLYGLLCDKYISELRSENSEGKVTEIGDHYFIRNNKRVDFDNAISTIPLNALFGFMSVKHNLVAKPVHYLHVGTDCLDFEGANQCLVVDDEYDFFKVTNVAPNRYLFYCHKDIVNPGVYFMQFMNKFDILDGTSGDNVIPVGVMPKLDIVEKNGISCIGSSAQWDWCMDIGSCILRLLKYANNGNKQSTGIHFQGFH